MELKFHDRINSLLKVLLIAMLANGVNAQRAYTCFGGCFNQCFQTTGTVQAGGFGCYYPCLNGCLPNSPADFQYYCQIGCSFKRCVIVAYDGQRMESCFDRCTNICQNFRGGSSGMGGGFPRQLPPIPPQLHPVPSRI